MDQANTLRRMVSQHRHGKPSQGVPRRQMRVIAVTSGKGGVGKTNTAVNLALALSRLQRRVLLLDGDMGLANIDVLLGLTPRYTLEHVVNGEKDVMDIVLEGPLGVKILPSSSGISELSEMNKRQQMHLFAELSRIDEDNDYLIIDTGAGISSNVLRFNAAASEVLLVVSPEPTAITDAYALMKLLAIKYHVRDFGLIANSVQSERDGHAVFERLNRVCEQFLQASLSYLGSIPFDKCVRNAVRQQIALLELYPRAPASRSLMRIAALIDQRAAASALPPSAETLSNPAFPPQPPASFWDRLLHWDHRTK